MRCRPAHEQKNPARQGGRRVARGRWLPGERPHMQRRSEPLAWPTTAAPESIARLRRSEKILIAWNIQKENTHS